MLNHFLVILSIFFTTIPFAYSQEWKNIKTYKKETGINVLEDGCWLKKDRKKSTEAWKNANRHNLSINNGHLNYQSIKQIQGFYLWADEERKTLGHEINTAGLLAIVSGQFSKLEHQFFDKIIIRNKEITWFGKEGSRKVFAFAFSFIKKVYFSKEKVIGKEAEDLDKECVKTEQCIIIEALYKQLTPKTIKQLSRIAKGKGIYSLGVKKKLRFEGDITNCSERYEHAFSKLLPYYLSRQ